MAQDSELAVFLHNNVAMLQSWGHRLIQSQGHMHRIIQPSLQHLCQSKSVIMCHIYKCHPRQPEQKNDRHYNLHSEFTFHIMQTARLQKQLEHGIERLLVVL